MFPGFDRQGAAAEAWSARLGRFGQIADGYVGQLAQVSMAP
jgi:hypothetical protein